KVYPEGMSNCPECFNKTPNNTAKTVIAVLCIVFGIICIIAAVISVSGDESANTPTSSITVSEQSEVEQTKAGVNYKNFEKIENGMTYNQVVEIFGGEGKVMSSVDLGTGDEYVTTIYYWYDWTGVANCNVTFQGGKVVAKAQVGLQ
ncbi:MAG: hypothetical protein IJY33_05255, partial [Oscillospiraceae bacterium]|nr:hypothetical protein [Oscillospiraceae bacterium]